MDAKSNFRFFCSIFTVINIFSTVAMKRFSQILLLCSITLLACVQTDEHRVHVQGEIMNLGKSTVHITYHNTLDELTYDTIVSSKDGSINFNIQTTEGISPIKLYFVEKKCWTTLFAEPKDEISITGDVNSIELLTIKGGTVNNELNRFKQKIRTLYQERLYLLKHCYFTEDQTEIRLAEINLQLKRAAKDFIRENPSSIASVVLIQDFFYQDYDPVTIDLLAILIDEAKSCKMTEKMRLGLSKWN